MRAAISAALALGLWSCGPRHINNTTPRQRVYDAGAYAQEDPASRPSSGSLFSEATGGWLEDTRAHHIGDTVMVRLDERADASGGANTAMTRESGGSSGISNFLGLIPALRTAVPEADPTRLWEFLSRSNFTGNGTTTRQGTLQGTLAVRVTRRLPNGDLFVEGTKVVLINTEEYHLYVSGIVRQVDIAPDDSVPSSRIADAQVEFSGSGDITENNRRGWLARFLEWINPF
jgi:flagellar L-ring protein precursor FlgH